MLNGFPLIPHPFCLNIFKSRSAWAWSLNTAYPNPRDSLVLLYSAIHTFSCASSKRQGASPSLLHKSSRARKRSSLVALVSRSVMKRVFRISGFSPDRSTFFCPSDSDHRTFGFLPHRNTTQNLFCTTCFFVGCKGKKTETTTAGQGRRGHLQLKIDKCNVLWIEDLMKIRFDLVGCVLVG